MMSERDNIFRRKFTRFSVLIRRSPILDCFVLGAILYFFNEHPFILALFQILEIKDASTIQNWGGMLIIICAIIPIIWVIKPSLRQRIFRQLIWRSSRR